MNIFFAATLLLIAAAGCFFFRLPGTERTVSSSSLTLYDRSVLARSEKRRRLEDRLKEQVRMLKESSPESRRKVLLLLILSLAFGLFLYAVWPNVFLLPAAVLCLAVVCFRILSAADREKRRQTQEDLLGTMQTVSASYLRVRDLPAAVREVLPTLRGPVKDMFASFLSDCSSVSPSLRSAVMRLRSRADDPYFLQWCDVLMLCVEDRTQIPNLEAVCDRMAAQERVGVSVRAAVKAARAEYFTMLALLWGNVPLLYLINRDWFSALLFSASGKFVLGLSALVSVLTYLLLHRHTDPGKTLGGFGP
ncbi:MAG: hypothetical protein IJR83_01760 [Clostridia bacterium]|nr:hypothetical protein [Clostridia bacterium]